MLLRLTKQWRPEQVFKALLATVIATAGEPEVADIAEPIVVGVSRHFAMLFAAGVGSKRDRETRACGTSLKELDPSIYLDALVEVGLQAPFRPCLYWPSVHVGG